MVQDVQRVIDQVQIMAEGLGEEEVLVLSNNEFAVLENPQAVIDQRDQEWWSFYFSKLSPFMESLMDNELSWKLKKYLESKDSYQRKYGYHVFSEVFVTNRYGANVAVSQRTSDYYQAECYFYCFPVATRRTG